MSDEHVTAHISAYFLLSCLNKYANACRCWWRKHGAQCQESSRCRTPCQRLHNVPTPQYDLAALFSHTSICTSALHLYNHTTSCTCVRQAQPSMGQLLVPLFSCQLYWRAAASYTQFSAISVTTRKKEHSSSTGECPLHPLPSPSLPS